MPWPYCPNCGASHNSLTLVWNRGEPAAWGCGACGRWWRLPEKAGDSSVDRAMKSYSGPELAIPARTLTDALRGTRRACGSFCDIRLAGGAVSCSCGLGGLP